MALVQKLTGLSRFDDEEAAATQHDHHQKSEPGNDADLKILNSDHENKNKNIGLGNHDDNESSSVVTDENCSSVGDFGQVINSCFVSPIFEPPTNAYMTNLPVFTPNSAEFLCSNQPFYNYNDPLFLTSGMTNGINEFSEY